jgi:hypothetical protein
LAQVQRLNIPQSTTPQKEARMGRFNNIKTGTASVADF